MRLNKEIQRVKHSYQLFFCDLAGSVVLKGFISGRKKSHSRPRSSGSGKVAGYKTTTLLTIRTQTSNRVTWNQQVRFNFLLLLLFFTTTTTLLLSYPSTYVFNIQNSYFSYILTYKISIFLDDNSIIFLSENTFLKVKFQTFF